MRDEATGCLLWQRSKSAAGYGNLTYQGVQVYAHRMAWEAANGSPIPSGMLVCHHCDVRSCIEPSHLFLGSHQDNMTDMVAKKRHAFGDKVSSAKLTTADVLAIREMDASIAVIGAHFGVNATYVAAIRRGERRRLG